MTTFARFAAAENFIISVIAMVITIIVQNSRNNYHANIHNYAMTPSRGDAYKSTAINVEFATSQDFIFGGWRRRP